MTGTERKVFQKYYPPEFDGSKVPKIRTKKASYFIQRVMTPFNMQCNTCNEYIYKGKKFNMKRETAHGEDYLGLKIFRFTFRCPNCLAEIKFKTDLENTDYTAESGATRLFEAYKLYQDQKKAEEEKEEAEKNDPMKMLEKRTQQSKAEMDALNELEELKEANRRNLNLNLDDLIEQKTSTITDDLKIQEDEDEALLNSLFNNSSGSSVSKVVDEIVEELPDSDESSDDEFKAPLPVVMATNKPHLVDFSYYIDFSYTI
ncbi:CWC16 protein family-containing protein [Strongyloides ratti]|uniref:Splicing factor YJU2 n=1 Tax=Strongyloides ratti TaxID=34506 RepID=A0A090L8M5_STRRB|nr:CWC16 protein family-containing protein [Strongyloides ratti]CEF63840.1 CWC16 protein family-containing protein [Strongyloides ratti]